ncbi:MAG: D-glycerate dehydrogenase [Alphaproteobacteria bacterium]
MASLKDKTVLVSRRVPENIRKRVSETYTAILNDDDRLYSTDELLQKADGADAVLCCHTEHFTADVIGRLPESVKIIANISVGTDHCDLAAAKAHGIVVTNTPDVLSDATAEIAMLLMLGAARRAGEGEAIMRADAWKDWSLAFMVGTQVTGKRLGLIGMGRVGQVFARRARAGLDMEIHYHNRSRLSSDKEAGAIYHDSVEELLPHCDFLSLHCPATPESKGLMNGDRLALLPKGAILVNTARGAVVDDEALIAALKSGHLAAAGLDVYNNEPNAHPGYRDLENTFLMPHIGSATHETRDAMGNRALDNLDAYFSGNEPNDRVA